jgi:hypothetical protein
MHNPRPLCAAPHCAIKARHRDTCQHADCVPDCSEDRCWGCLPRWAADGLLLCDVDTRRIAEDAGRAADQYLGLESSIIRRGGGGEQEKTSGSSSGAPVPDDEVMDTRVKIRDLLGAIVRLISEQRGVTRPGGGRSAPELAPRPNTKDPAGLTAHRPDDLRPLAAFIARHAEWIAAHRYGPTIARDLRNIAGDGRIWALAYPAGSDRLYIGDCPAILTDDDGAESTCGNRLYQYAGQPLVECSNCGVRDTLEQWRRWVVADAHGEVNAYTLASHLAQTWMRPVDPAVIRQWASRGKIAALTEPDPDVRGSTRPKRDERRRVMYDLAAAVEYAETIWGPPAELAHRRIA